MPSLTETKTDCVKPVFLTGTLTYQSPRVDATTHVLTTIDYAHHEIHDGSSYFICTTNEDFDTAELLNITFTTPALTVAGIHILFKVSNTAASRFEILEAPTVTANSGSALAVYNMNRNSANVTSVKSIATVPISGATLTSTVTVDGTVIYTDLAGLGRDGGYSEKTHSGEIILKASTTYVFRLTGLADNGLASINLSWYEHINKTA
jgi:hypothetical protein